MNIFNRKIRFNFVGKVSVVFVDSKFINLNLKNFSSIYLDKSEINFWILLTSLFLRIFSLTKNLSDIYFFQYYKKLNPKILISNDVNGVIFRYKKFFPNKKTIMYQTVNWINLWKPTIKNFYNPKNDKRLKLKTDYFCFINKRYLSFLNILRTNFIETGSVKTNSKSFKKNKKKYDLGFVSTYNDNSNAKSYYGTNNNLSALQLHLASASFIIRLLKKFSKFKKKKIKSVVLLNSNREDKLEKIKRENEIDFFKRDFKEINFINGKNHNIASNCEMLIVHDSSFAFELLALKKKFLYIEPLNILNKSLLSTFSRKNEGLFWYHGNNEKKILNKINYLLKLTEKNWKKKLDKTNIKVKYDKNNKILNNLVLKILNR